MLRKFAAARSALLVASCFAIASCATVPTGPLAPGELRLLKLQPPETIRAGVPYDVLVSFQVDGPPSISRACFFWSGSISREGPYCFGVRDVEPGSPGTFKVRLRTNNRGTYTLNGYVEYFRDGKTDKSNEVSAWIAVQ